MLDCHLMLPPLGWLWNFLIKSRVSGGLDSTSWGCMFTYLDPKGANGPETIWVDIKVEGEVVFFTFIYFLIINIALLCPRLVEKPEWFFFNLSQNGRIHDRTCIWKVNNHSPDAGCALSYQCSKQFLWEEPFSISNSTKIIAHANMSSLGLDLSIYLPSVSPMLCIVSSFQQCDGNFEKWTRTRIVEGMSCLGFQYGVHMFRGIPLVPNKYGSFLKMIS